MNFIYRKESHIVNITEAFLVVIIWATSWIIIKNNLSDIPPLFFAGSRYFLASVFLILWCAASGKIKELKSIRKKTWPILILLGIALYAFAQAGQYIALIYLPSSHVSLFMNFFACFCQSFRRNNPWGKTDMVQGERDSDLYFRNQYLFPSC